MNLMKFWTSPLILNLILVGMIVSCVNSRPPLLEGIIIAPEERCSKYKREDYRYPQSIEKRIMKEMSGIYDPYVKVWLESPYQSDIEHVVAAAEAHDSGLCAAIREEKMRFAQDPLNLVLAGAYLNRYVKVAKDAGEWLPEENVCWYIKTIADVKRKYDLTMDQREFDAIVEANKKCVSYEMEVTRR